MNIASLILAAGKGTRMKSKLPKVLHKVGGKAMVERVLETVQSIGTNRDVVIVGFGGDAVQNYLGDRAEFVRQEEQNGTGHAVKWLNQCLVIMMVQSYYCVVILHSLQGKLRSSFRGAQKFWCSCYDF